MGKDLEGKELGSRIRQRKDGLYEGRYGPATQEKSIYDRNLNTLKRRLKVFRQTSRRRADKITVDQMYQRFREERMEKAKTRTVENNDHQYSLLQPYIGSKRMVEVTQWELQELFRQMERKYAHMTVEHILALLRMVFQRARELKLIEENPVRQVVLNGSRTKAKECVLHPKKDQPVFPSSTGNPITHKYALTQLQKITRKIIPDGNKDKLTGTVLRNTFSYRCYMSGLPLACLAAIVGISFETCMETVETFRAFRINQDKKK